ncbi:MAG TPA: zf-HC2 domain-containing protein [Pyrinomonadaceae bacterium]|nr:zf-HC2 domain-containing protein [Pyrinomonadaceae bacterium]
MNCEKCQELVSDLLDGSLNRQDELVLNQHLDQCLECADVRRDLESIVGFCRAHQNEYTAPPNERALWLRIRNIIEVENQAAAIASGPLNAQPKSVLGSWLNRSWELSLPQLAASVAALALVVSLTTVVVLRRSESTSPSATRLAGQQEASSINSRTWQQQQAINYWNQRVELNKARWSQDMRDTFDRNLRVIDQAVNNSLGELNHNPHDEVSEEMLNAALNEKLALLKEFADL